MLRKLLAPLAALGLLALAGCDVFDDDDDNPLVPTATIGALHASPDAPAVNILVDGEPLASGADYKASVFTVVDPGTYTVQVDGILPSGPATVIQPADVTVAADTITTIVALGEVADIAPLVLTRPRTAPPAGEVRVTVLHGAPNAPAVDVYATTPGADLAQSAPLGSFSFSQTLGPVEVPAGDYQIRVTLAGDDEAVVFDSGELALREGLDLLITAVEDTTTSEAPISLVVIGDAQPAEVLDVGTPAALRVIHNSPDAPAVDVVVNDDFDQPLIEDLAFPNVAPNPTDFVAVPADDYNVKVTVANDPGTIAIDEDLTLDAGVEYSVYAVNVLAEIEAQVLVDDRRSVATEAKVRIVHGSPNAGDVDIYVTAQGADITNLEPNVAGFEFQDDTGYIALEGGTYTVTVTGAGTKTAAIGPLDITIADGGVYTAVARDPLVPGSGDFGLILLDDFN